MLRHINLKSVSDFDNKGCYDFFGRALIPHTRA